MTFDLWQVVAHLKDALVLTLDDVQLWVMDSLDGALDQLERLSDTVRTAVLLVQDTQVGRAASTGLDDVLSRLEAATAYYLPLPQTLREYRFQMCGRPSRRSHPSWLWCAQGGSGS